MTMCGIAGFSLNPKDTVNAKRLSKAMLLDIESRGRDATGFAFLDSSGKIQIHKRPLPATKFVAGRLCMPKRASCVIMHTRFATQGEPENNDNNHPIWAGGVVGVHNGWVHNDDSIFAGLHNKLGEDVRIAEVDSEAIFAALGYGDKSVTETLGDLYGNVAVAWLDQGDEIPNRLHLSRVDTSPLVLGSTPNGSLLFASTESAIRAGARAVGLTLSEVTHCAEGQYFQVLDGEFLKIEKFEPSYRKSYSRYSTTSRYSGGTTTYGRTLPGTTSRRGLTPWDDDDLDDGVFDLHSYMDKVRADREKALKARTPIITTPETLADKLAAEIAELGDEDATSPDEDDELYQQWLQENAAEIDHILDKEEVYEAKFVEYLKSPKVNMYMLAHAEYAMPAPNEAEYLKDPRHIEREQAAEAWFDGVKADDQTKENAGRAMRINVRPGTPVTTKMAGYDVQGHVVEVPSTFPAGEYIIRAFIPANPSWKNKEYQTEAILVARQYWQFDVIDKVGVITGQKALPAGKD